MSKLHWRIRLDTMLGYALNKITKGKFSEFIKDWYDHKYRSYDGFDMEALPARLLLGIGYYDVEDWYHVEGIALPIALINSYQATSMVVVDAVNSEVDDAKFDFIIVTSELMDIMTEDEAIAVLHHEMRHSRRHWIPMNLRTRIMNKVMMDSSRPAMWMRLDKILFAPILWMMEFDADRVPKEYRRALASALMKILEDAGTTQRLAGMCATHPPSMWRAFFLRSTTHINKKEEE